MTTDLLLRRDNLRRLRVATRKRIEQANQIADVVERHRRVDSLQTFLKMTEPEWREIQHSLAIEQGLATARRQAYRPAARTVTRSSAPYLTRALIGR